MELHGVIGIILGYIELYRDNGKENGSYYLGLRVEGYLKMQVQSFPVKVPVLNGASIWRLSV